MANASDLIDEAIAELEARLNLKPGEAIPIAPGGGGTKRQPTSNKQKKKANKKAAAPAATVDDNLPPICKLSFKVGVITKVWVHEKADKLYCEEIDVGEDAPRQIASGLRPHFTEEQMLGQRLLVVSNLKAKNLVGFKSHGMVLCAARTNADGTDTVEFVEPPAAAVVGEVVEFDGLPKPQPVAPNQVEKKKLFQACTEGMKTTAEGVAAWNGHQFMTSAGPCTTKTIKEGVLR